MPSWVWCLPEKRKVTVTGSMVFSPREVNDHQKKKKKRGRTDDDTSQSRPPVAVASTTLVTNLGWALDPFNTLADIELQSIHAHFKSFFYKSKSGELAQLSDSRSICKTNATH